jgi:hypothetical protein
MKDLAADAGVSSTAQRIRPRLQHAVRVEGRQGIEGEVDGAWSFEQRSSFLGRIAPAR